MSETTKMETLIEEIRKTPIFRQLIPMEAQIGWPSPLRRDGRVYVTLLFFGASPKEKGNTVLYPPFAKITLNWVNQVPVEYLNLRFQNPFPEVDWEGEVGTFPHEAVARMTVGEYQEKRKQLLGMYSEILNNLSEGRTFSDEWNKQFSDLLTTLMEPPLEPYYRAIAPKFFDRFLKNDQHISTY